jgi:EAL domain-containing protein (putative c-di-GMP-specific phosphodiesterase class I)/PleD family two-component response regulator
MQVMEPISGHSRARATFVAQIAQRAGELFCRGERLCRGAWDINAALLLAEDAEALASTSHRLGDSATAGDLEEFAERLWTLLDPPVVPDADASASISAILETLIAESKHAAAQAGESARPATLPGCAASESNGFPLLVQPPAQYWRRFAPDAPASSPSPTFAEKPPTAKIATAPTVVETRIPIEAPAVPAPVAAAPRPVHETIEVDTIDDADPARQTVCHLGDGSTLSREIDLQLRAQGYALQHPANVDQLKEALSRTPPSLVILGSAFHSAIEEIGALVQAARARTGRRLNLVALSTQTDLNARLRAMRAGCDAFIAEPATADDILARVRELDGIDPADPYRILIVEDDRSQALFAETILRKSGMRPLAIGEASLVLEKLDAFQPDLILMDLNMPECDGMELTALIREREAFISTPIVFLSGENDTEKHFEALSAGGDDFLSKPIAPRHLIAAVTSRVRRARQLERRRHVPVVREPIKGLHDVVQLSRRLTEMLSMEDAAIRHGGLLFIEVEDAPRLHGRLGTRAIETLFGKLTATLAGHIGANDMLARCGEGGFLLLNPDRSSASLEKQAINLRERIAHESFGEQGASMHVGVVIGICPFVAKVGDAKAMIDAAERAMLEARSPDRGGVFVLHAEQPDQVDEVVIEAIRRALDNSGFRTIFQPIVSLHGEEEEQFQALLRLPAEDGRVYAASELVPAAEHAGLIADVDRWMLENCLATIAENLRDGRSLRLFVSQSLDSMRDPERVEWMRKALESHRVPASQVSLELRMSDAIEALSDIVAFTLAMKQLGTGLTLSGFEAGARGTEMLRHLPVDFVKLSARYTVAHDDSVRAELRELVKLAHASGRRVIAPRVEEARVAASLWSCGIDLIQGNFVQQAARDMSYDFRASSG